MQEFTLRVHVYFKGRCILTCKPYFIKGASKELALLKEIDEYYEKINSGQSMAFELIDGTFHAFFGEMLKKISFSFKIMTDDEVRAQETEFEEMLNKMKL